MKEVKAAILGAGSRGTALAQLLAENGLSPRLWSLSATDVLAINEKKENPVYLPGYPLHEAVIASTDIEEVLTQAELIIIAVPSQALLQTLHAFKKYYKGQGLILASKGWQSSKFLPFSDIIGELLGQIPLSVLSGGSHAEEVMRKMPTGVILASQEKAYADRVIPYFHNQWFKCNWSPDLIGVQLMGAFKNVIALSCGIAEGLGYGANTKALLMTQGIQELSKIGEEIGASGETFRTFAGIGDLYVTCSSPLSRNWNAGRLLAQGHSKEEITGGLMKMVAEGLNMMIPIKNFLNTQKSPFPFLEMVIEIVGKPQDATKIFAHFLNRL